MLRLGSPLIITREAHFEATRESDMPDAPPYSDLVGTADPLALLTSSPLRIAAIVRSWSSAHWSRSYAPGKWSAAQIVLHLAQDEVAWSCRARLALTEPDYVPHPFEGADWVALESPSDPQVALEAFLSLRQFNLLLYRRLTPEQRSRPFGHPELGHISVDWILHVLAGHDLHHIKHLEAAASL